jgi:holin-like protein
MFHLFGAFFILLLSLFIGQWLSTLLPLSLPGPLLGLLLLFFALLILGYVPKSLDRLCQWMLQHLSIFFVPATLGVMLYQDEFAQHGVLIAVALLVSTFVSLLLTAWLSQYLQRNREKSNAK